MIRFQIRKHMEMTPSQFVERRHFGASGTGKELKFCFIRTAIGRILSTFLRVEPHRPVIPPVATFPVSHGRQLVRYASLVPVLFGLCVSTILVMLISNSSLLDIRHYNLAQAYVSIATVTHRYKATRFLPFFL